MVLRWSEHRGQSDGWLALLELLASRSGVPLEFWMEQELEDPALTRATTRMAEAFAGEEDQMLTDADTAALLSGIDKLFKQED